MPDFCAAIKVLLENRLVPTVAGLVSGALIYVFSDEDNWILLKLGKLGYGLLWAGIVFLIITFIQYCFKQCKRLLGYIKEKKEDKEYEEKEKLKLMEDLWFFMDEQEQEYIDFLKRFLDNGNDFIEESIWYEPGYKRETFKYREIILRRQMEIDGEAKVIYKMDDVIYAWLKESKEKYNRISHFE